MTSRISQVIESLTKECRVKAVAQEFFPKVPNETNRIMALMDLL